MDGKYYLNPLNLATRSSFLWYCSLKISGVEFEFPTDIITIFNHENGIAEEEQELFIITQKQIVNTCLIMMK